MSQILEVANKIAVALKYPLEIAPVSKWVIPHFHTEVAGFKLVTLGKLTSAELTCVQGFRSAVAMVAQSQKLGVYSVFLEIGQVYGLETIKDITELLSDTPRYLETSKELGVSDEKISAWNDALTLVGEQFDVTRAVESMKVNIVTLLMCLRHDKDWDFESTSQLTEAEFDGLYAFFLEEEGDQLAVEGEEDKKLTVKKP